MLQSTVADELDRLDDPYCIPLEPGTASIRPERALSLAAAPMKTLGNKLDTKYGSGTGDGVEEGALTAPQPAKCMERIRIRMEHAIFRADIAGPSG